MNIFPIVFSDIYQVMKPTESLQAIKIEKRCEPCRILCSNVIGILIVPIYISKYNRHTWFPKIYFLQFPNASLFPYYHIILHKERFLKYQNTLYLNDKSCGHSCALHSLIKFEMSLRGSRQELKKVKSIFYGAMLDW
jgi:hypothetical protein